MTVLNSRTKPSAMNSLSRLSVLMCAVVAIGGALGGLALAWVWLSPALIQTMVVPHLGLTGAPVSLDHTTRAAGLAISMVPMVVLLFMLHQSYALFAAFRLGNVFNATAPMRLRRIGLCMVALGALRPLTTTLLGLALTWSNTPGQRILAIALSLDDYMIAAFGGLVVAIGHVMVVANSIADDNRQIV